MAVAFRAFVASDPVLPPPVPHEGNPAFGAPWVPFVPLRKLGLIEPGPFPFPAIRFGSEQGQGGRQFGVVHRRHGFLVQHENPFQGIGRRSGEGMNAKQPIRSASQSPLIV